MGTGVCITVRSLYSCARNIGSENDNSQVVKRVNEHVMMVRIMVGKSVVNLVRSQCIFKKLEISVGKREISPKKIFTFIGASERV